MSECLMTRRGGGGAFTTLPLLNDNYPEDSSITFISGDTASASFSVNIDVDGNPAEYTYQWYLDGEAVNGENSPNYTWSGATGGTYSVHCAVTNEAGTVVSRTATLSVVMYYKPVLNPNYPADYSGMRSNGYFDCVVNIAEHGNPAEYTYQWFINGTPYSGATHWSFSYGRMNPIGTYSIYCEVTNIAGTVRSRTATITLTDTYLYGWGNEYANVTGGWQMTKALSTSNTSYSLGNFSKSTSGLTLHLYTNQGHDGFVGTKNKIDLTHYSKIRFTINDSYSNCSNSYKHYLVATSINNNDGATNGIVAQTIVTVPMHTSTQEVRTYDVDISGISGSYYVGFLSWLWIAESRFRVSAVQLIL